MICDIYRSLLFVVLIVIKVAELIVLTRSKKPLTLLDVLLIACVR